MTTAILVPLSRDLAGHRLAAWRHVRSVISERGELYYGFSDPGPGWSKGTAVAQARAQTDADILVVHDADVMVSAEALEAAVSAVRDGAPWAIPHREVYRLAQLATITALTDTSPTGVASGTDLDRPPYVGYAGGGITVVRADVWDACPIDPRFTGWGSEDEAWGWALGCLYGHPWRGISPLIHYYHPHAAPGARRATSPEAHLLWRSYRAHRNRPDLMRDIVAQATRTVH